MRAKVILLSVVVCLAPVLASAATLTEITRVKVDPRGTYFATASNDPAGAPSSLDLGAVGIAAGERIFLREIGEYSRFASSQYDTLNGGYAVFADAAGNFLSPAAADSSAFPAVSPPALNGLATDVPQDFGTSLIAVSVVVPEFATQLLFSIHDVFFGDNTDANQNFYVVVSRDVSAVPLPASALMLALAIGSFGALRRAQTSRARGDGSRRV